MIPQLELLGAELLAKLLTKVRELLNVGLDCVYGFSNSQVALAWIKGSADRFQVFIQYCSCSVNNMVPFNG